MASTDDNFGNPVPDETGSSSDQDGVPLEGSSLGTEDVTLMSATLEKFRLELLEKERQLKADLAERDRVLEEIQIAVEQLRITTEQGSLKLKADQADKDRELEEILKSLKFRNGKSDHPESKERSDSTWKEKVEEFAGSTSMPGAPKIILNKNPVKRIVWFLIFVGCWAMFMYQTTLLVENYLTYPKKTNQEVVYDVPFPGFTICLNRGVSFYDAQKWLAEKNASLPTNLVESDFEPWYHPAYRSVEYNSFVDKSSISKEEAMVFLEVKYLDGVNRGFVNKFLRLEEIPGGKFFKCFTVSPLDEYKYPIEEIQAGVMDGVGMVPNMSEHGDYIWRRQSGYGGYRVYVHPVGFKVNPNEEKRYFEIEQGHDVNISINAVEEFVRIGSPHGNCSERNPYASTGSREREAVYQQDECMRQCMNEKTLEEYNFISLVLPPPANMNCSDCSARKEQCNCTTMVNGRPKNITVGAITYSIPGYAPTCPCHRPCVEIEYAVAATYKPRYRQKEDIYTFFRRENPIAMNEHWIKANYSGRFGSGVHSLLNVTTGKWSPIKITGDDGKLKFIEEYIQKDEWKAAADVSKLSIRMQMFNRKMERTVESPLYTSAQLVSEIGGQLGVWIGISVITLTEVIELVIEICCEASRGKKKKDKVDDITRGTDIIAV